MCWLRVEAIVNRWLFSTEPDSYPWQKVEKEKRVRWDGIRGGAAQKYMRQIQPGDEILAYHSAPEKSVVGIAVAASRSYPDRSVPKEEQDKWHVIDVSWKRWLSAPVPISEMRQMPELAAMKFVRMPRLSISPVTTDQWQALLDRGRRASAK
jgi:predicted RNA-binding protein with PUA-like domain